MCSLDIGAGKNVTTVRENSDRVAEMMGERGAKCTIVRINPDFPGIDGIYASNIRFTPLPGKGLAILEKLNAMIFGKETKKEKDEITLKL